MTRTPPPAPPLRRILENAGLLIFASLLVMSIVLERYGGALLWCGALLVFFAHAWEGRSPSRAAPDPGDATDEAPTRYNLLRWIGVTLALVGAIALTL